MRRIMLGVAIGLVSFGLLLAEGRRADAAAAPEITSILEGRDSESGRASLIVVGKGVSKFRTYALRDGGGADVGAVEVTLKTSTMTLLRLPAGLVAGDYALVTRYGKNGEQVHYVTIANGTARAGTLTREVLSPATLLDLDDAVTVGGRSASEFALVSQTISTAGATMTGKVTVNVTNGDSIVANTTSGAGRGVFSLASSTTGPTVGVWAQSDSTSGIGLFGAAPAGTGNVYGVYGQVNSVSGRGVFGESRAATGASVGVQGSVVSDGGTGVTGYASSTFGGTVGVSGRVDSPDGTGVFGTITSTTGSGYGVAGATASASGTGVYGVASHVGGSGTGVRGVSTGSGGIGVVGHAGSTTGATIGVRAISESSSGWGLHAIASGSGSGTAALVAEHTGSSGEVAIFRTSGVNVARIDRSGKGYFNGGTQTSGADFAESVEVNRPKSEFEPGDVIVIDVGGKRRFALSTEAESPLVAGIYATSPGVLARLGGVAGSSEWEATEVPMAITGIVPCKVCDEGGPVRTGDLLVSASLPGYAKKAPASPKPGSLLGKALAPLEGARGVVEVLITMR